MSADCRESEKGSKTRQVAFLIDSAPQFTELFRIAEVLQTEDNWALHFIFGDTYSVAKFHKRLCRSRNIKVVEKPFGKEKVRIFLSVLPIVFYGHLRRIINQVSRFALVFVGSLGRGFATFFEFVVSMVRSCGIPPLGTGIFSRILVAVRSIRDKVHSFSVRKLTFPSKHPDEAVSSEYGRLSDRLLANKKTLLDNQIDLLILARDCAYYDTVVWVKAARCLEIKTVLIPFDDADQKALADHRAGHQDHVIVSRLAKEVAIKHPKWVLESKNELLLLVPPERVLALEKLGMDAPHPWQYNSSRCDLILVESEVRKQSFVRNGAPSEQVFVTGSIYHDKLSIDPKVARRRRGELLAKLDIDDDKKLVLAAVSPNKFDERPSVPEHSSYRDLISYWVRTLVRYRSFNVIFCLHPSVDPRDVRFIRFLGAHVVEEDTASLLPLCDVYVVDCSATSRWALAAGKLVIDYDFYQYNLDFHSKLDGIFHVKTKADFEDVLAQLGNGDLDGKLAGVADKEQISKWGKLDGNASRRITNKLASLVDVARSQKNGAKRLV